MIRRRMAARRWTCVGAGALVVASSFFSGVALAPAVVLGLLGSAAYWLFLDQQVYGPR